MEKVKIMLRKCKSATAEHELHHTKGEKSQIRKILQAIKW